MASVVWFAAKPHIGSSWHAYGSQPPTELNCGDNFAVGNGVSTPALVSMPVSVDVTLPTARYWALFLARIFLVVADEGNEVVVWKHGAVDAELELRAFGVVGGEGTYRLRLYASGTQLGETTTTFTSSTTVFHRIRITLLPGSQAALEVDDVLELNVATTQAMPNGRASFGGGSPGVSLGSIAWKDVICIRGDSSADRPSDASGGWEIKAAMTAANGGLTSWTGTEADWDDWDACGASDDDTTFCTAPTTEGSESSTHAAVTLTQKPRAVSVYQRSRHTGGSGSKSLGTVLVYDGTTERRVSIGNVTAPSSYGVGVYGVFNKHPDGADWDTQARVNGADIGRRGASVADVSDLRCTAIGAEVVAYDLDAGDPPAVTASLLYRAPTIRTIG